MKYSSVKLAFFFSYFCLKFRKRTCRGKPVHYFSFQSRFILAFRNSTSCRIRIVRCSKPGLSVLAFGSPEAPFWSIFYQMNSHLPNKHIKEQSKSPQKEVVISLRYHPNIKHSLPCNSHHVLRTNLLIKLSSPNIGDIFTTQPREQVSLKSID